jgi:hypothetical protein
MCRYHCHTTEGISDAIAFCDAPPGAVVAAASRGM